MSIPFESVVVALLTGIFGYAIAWFNNRSRIKAEERQRKEGQYYGFIGELIKCKSNDRTHEYSKDTMAELTQQVYLVGSVDVIKAMNDFLAIMKGERSNDHQDQVYASLLKAMREDLYGHKGGVSFPDEIRLTVFQ